MVRAVYNNNIWVSWELGRGASFWCVQAIEAGKVQHFHSDAMIAEFADVLRRRTQYMEEVIYALLYEYRYLSTKVEITGDLHVVIDPDDDKIIECALIVGAEYIVSQDHHFLDLVTYEGIKILHPNDFVKLLEE